MAIDQSLYPQNTVASMTNFRDVDVSTLQARYREFKRLIPERVSVLESTIQRNDGYADWKADFSIESLQRLNDWLGENATARRREAAEIAELRRRFSAPIPIPDIDLSVLTLSLVHDAAMYLASTFVHRYPQLEWTINLHDKLDADFGQPILVGFVKRLQLNPVRILSTVAYAIVDGAPKPRHLVEAFQFWSQRVSPPPTVM